MHCVDNNVICQMFLTCGLPTLGVPAVPALMSGVRDAIVFLVKHTHTHTIYADGYRRGPLLQRSFLNVSTCHKRLTTAVIYYIVICKHIFGSWYNIVYKNILLMISKPLTTKNYRLVIFRTIYIFQQLTLEQNETVIV